MMLETFSPSPVTSMMSSATPETLFITGTHCPAPSGECDLNISPESDGDDIVTINDLAMSQAFT